MVDVMSGCVGKMHFRVRGKCDVYGRGERNSRPLGGLLSLNDKAVWTVRFAVRIGGWQGRDLLQTHSSNHEWCPRMFKKRVKVYRTCMKTHAGRCVRFGAVLHGAVPHGSEHLLYREDTPA